MRPAAILAGFLIGLVNGLLGGMVLGGLFGYRTARRMRKAEDSLALLDSTTEWEDPDPDGPGWSFTDSDDQEDDRG